MGKKTVRLEMGHGGKEHLERRIEVKKTFWGGQRVTQRLEHREDTETSGRAIGPKGEFIYEARANVNMPGSVGTAPVDKVGKMVAGVSVTRGAGDGIHMIAGEKGRGPEAVVTFFRRPGGEMLGNGLEIHVTKQGGQTVRQFSPDVIEIGRDEKITVYLGGETVGPKVTVLRRSEK